MSMGNIAEELRQMTPGKAGSTTQLYPMFKTEDGIVLAYSAITASATLTALVDDGVTKFAYGCQVICVHSDAVATVLCLVNFGAATAPNFYSMMTAGIEG
ncbi:MAG: hypothetical protein ACYTEO_18535 [Planctomycetota bacterium]|jgi:hypothetical protein